MKKHCVFSKTGPCTLKTGPCTLPGPLEMPEHADLSLEVHGCPKDVRHRSCTTKKSCVPGRAGHVFVAVPRRVLAQWLLSAALHRFISARTCYYCAFKQDDVDAALSLNTKSPQQTFTKRPSFGHP